jgi:hypothetical protein
MFVGFRQIEKVAPRFEQQIAKNIRLLRMPRDPVGAFENNR